MRPTDPTRHLFNGLPGAAACAGTSHASRSRLTSQTASRNAHIFTHRTTNRHARFGQTAGDIQQSQSEDKDSCFGMVQKSILTLT